jgi:hypothetical protein
MSPRWDYALKGMWIRGCLGSTTVQEAPVGVVL